MIFNETPYYNEPGFEFRGDPARSTSYNRVVRQLTVQHAMLDWLDDRLASPLSAHPTAHEGGSTSSSSSTTATTTGTSRSTSTSTSTRSKSSRRSNSKSRKSSNEESKVIERATDDTIWGEVVRAHFARRAAAIVARVREWEREEIRAVEAGNEAQAPYLSKIGLPSIGALRETLERRMLDHGFLDRKQVRLPPREM